SYDVLAEQGKAAGGIGVAADSLPEEVSRSQIVALVQDAGPCGTGRKEGGVLRYGVAGDRYCCQHRPFTEMASPQRIVTSIISDGMHVDEWAERADHSRPGRSIQRLDRACEYAW